MIQKNDHSCRKTEKPIICSKIKRFTGSRSYTMRMLKRGDKGEEVYKLSQELVDLGLLDAPQDAFDDEVERAVKAWQVHGVDRDGKKLSVDGIVGPKTWESFEVSTDEIFSEPVPDEFYTIPEGGTEIGRTALQIAVQEMWNDAREIGKNNSGKFVEKYHRRNDASELQWAWCAAFTSWCFWRASEALGVEMPFKYTGGAQNIYRQLDDKGMTYEPSESDPPEPGDICVWWRGETKSWQGHVGIVWGYNNGIVYVVEGNVGQYPARVRVFDYVLEDMRKLIGFARVETPEEQND